MTERAAPFYCPYCGDEDLRPSEAGHGSWACGSCLRHFGLKYLGLSAAAASFGRPSAEFTDTSGFEPQRVDPQHPDTQHPDTQHPDTHAGVAR